MPMKLSRRAAPRHSAAMSSRATTATGARSGLVWVDRQGQEAPLPAPPRSYVYPRLSPDGTRLALFISDQELDIWLWDLSRPTLTRVSSDQGLENYPVWALMADRSSSAPTAVSGRHEGSIAGVDGRRHAAAVGAEQSRAVLSCGDGRRDARWRGGRVDVGGDRTDEAVRGTRWRRSVLFRADI